MREDFSIRALRWLVVLVALAPAGARAEYYTFRGVVVAAPPASSGERPGVMVRRDRDGLWVNDWVGLRETAITWHLDPNLRLPPSALRPGTRVGVFGSYWVADRVVVFSLGPHAFTAAVEEWVASGASGPWQGLSRGECLTIEAMGSPSHFVREAVSDALGRRGMGALKVLIWARHAPDQEIRTRAELLLTRLGWEP